MKRPFRVIVIVLLLLAAAGEVAYRFPLRQGQWDPTVAGPVRKPFEWDFANAYSASRAWLHGTNPYDKANIVDEWRSAGEQPWPIKFNLWAAVHPPTTLVMLAPLAPLPALPAMLTWFTFAGVLFVAEIVALVWIAELSCRDSRTWVLIAALLASAPVQVALISGQMAAPSVALVVLGVACVLRARDVAGSHAPTAGAFDLFGGILLGLASAIKIQIGLPFVLYYLVLRRWRVALPALLIVAVVAAVGIAPMEARHFPWLSSWRNQIASTVVPGGMNDPNFSGRYRFEILNVHVLLHGFLQNEPAIRLIGGAIVAALLALYLAALARAGRGQNRSDELLALAALSGLTLIPVYHKIYDASILVFALVWAIAALGTARDTSAKLVLLCLSIFLIPADVIQVLRIRVPAVDRAAEHSWWFNTFLTPHYAWGLLALCVMLVLIFRRNDWQHSQSNCR
jgi:hypothetical protein